MLEQVGKGPGPRQRITFNNNTCLPNVERATLRGHLKWALLVGYTSTNAAVSAYQIYYRYIQYC